MMTQQNNPQNVVFQALDAVPAQTWYLLGIASIAASLIFQLSGKKNAADFVGKWPPTFFAIGLYHKMIRPGQEDAMGKIQNAAEMAQDKARQVGM